MTFLELSTFLDRIAATPGRLAMTDILAEMFGHMTSREAAMSCYLITGRVAPMFIPIEFNIAEKSVLRVLEGISSQHGVKMNIKSLYEKTGDLGSMLEEIGGWAENASSVRKKEHGTKMHYEKLDISAAYDKLWGICEVGGTGSVEIRNRLVGSLLGLISPVEGKYILRILTQTMRLGCSNKTVLDALSVLRNKDKQDRNLLERAFGVCSDLGYVAQTYLNDGSKGLTRMSVIPGVPVFSMLVEREKDAESIMERIPEAMVQPKYDGIRCQIHVGVDEGEVLSDRVWWKHWQSILSCDQRDTFFSSGKEKKPIRLFSRNLEDMTHMFPEVVEAAQGLPVTSAIFDSEVIGYNERTDRFAPFQETMIRKRKYKVENAQRDVPIKVFVFDVLYLDGNDVTQMSNDERMRIVEEKVAKKGTLNPSGTYTATSAKELQRVFEDTIRRGLEGVVIKDPRSVYRPGVRGFDWIKLKRSSKTGMSDTIDVVIMGYYFGRGKQVNFGMGALLGGLYDRDSDTFRTVTKIGTGITDEQWRKIKHDLVALRVKEKPRQYEVRTQLVPGSWVLPKIVATVEADEITRSPVHTAGKGKTGYALRFPRLKIWARDRNPEDATTLDEVIAMYERKKG